MKSNTLIIIAVVAVGLVLLVRSKASGSSGWDIFGDGDSGGSGNSKSSDKSSSNTKKSSDTSQAVKVSDVDPWIPGLDALAAGVQLFTSIDEIPEGSMGVVEFDVSTNKGIETYPMVVEKYNEMNRIQPLEAEQTPSALRQAVSTQSVKQLIDVIQSNNLDTTDQATLTQIGKLDTEIRLANTAAAGVAWEETHLSIDTIPTGQQQKFAQLWAGQLDAFKAAGGKVSAATEAAIKAKAGV